jgi:hypothetical protein
MMDRIYLIEKELVCVLSVLLIFFNLICLYFIIDLLSYDEIIAYLANGELESSDPRDLALILFGTTVSNMLFVLVLLMLKICNKE